MTRNPRRRRHTHPTVPAGTTRAVVLDRTAQLIRAELRRCQLDLAPAATLAPLLGVTPDTLHAAAYRDPDLGTCGSPGHPMIWSLPPGPITAGFHPTPTPTRLTLTLPGSPTNPHPLTLTGHHLGPTGPDADQPGSTGRGELGHTIIRIHRMAQRWMIHPTGPHPQLFDLIAHTWQNHPTITTPNDRLRIYQTDHPTPIATRYWDNAQPTHQLELVIWTTENGHHQLVNIYPGGTHHTLIGLEAAG